MKRYVDMDIWLAKRRGDIWHFFPKGAGPRLAGGEWWRSESEGDPGSAGRRALPDTPYEDGDTV